MAFKLFFIVTLTISTVSASSSDGQMSLVNVTRLSTGDVFSLIGSDCGPTRCMEASHGTALAAMVGDSSDCKCRCLHDTPAFRQDRSICVNLIDECTMASFGRGTNPTIPFVFLPLKGQIIYPSKEIVFTDVEDAICAVTSAQYLSASGWVTLRDVVDNDVPFGLYRDEGSTFLQWRGSAGLHAKLDGQLVAVHVLCSTSTIPRLIASCAGFRVAGASQNPSSDVRSIPFHAGETVNTEPATKSQGLSVLESLAIGVCVLLLIFVYAAGIIIYINYKQRQKRKDKDLELSRCTTSMSSGNESSLESQIDIDNVMLKTNPLLKLDDLNESFMHETDYSDRGEHIEDTRDSSPNNMHKFQKLNSNVISAMVHGRRMKQLRPSLRSNLPPERSNQRHYRRVVSPDSFERAPHSDLSIIDCSMENNNNEEQQQPLPSHGELALRKKLYFNPIFFEIELLKNPPPAAIEFLLKIREVMTIAKEKLSMKRFTPILSDIPEENFYHSIDLGSYIPCARRGRRYSAISLKQENSRKAHCGGCPGCDSSVQPSKVIPLTRSNSCKTCVSDEYKQRIVRQWLEEVPIPMPAKLPVKSVVKVSATQKAIETKNKDQPRPNSAELIRSEDTKPKITETVLKETVTDSKIIESVVKVKQQDDKLKLIKMTKLEGIKKENIDSKPVITVTMQENKSPTNHTSRLIRKKLPPPPPPPPLLPSTKLPQSSKDHEIKKEEEEPVSPDLKLKMKAVIRELHESCQREGSNQQEKINLELTAPIVPKIVIPVIAADSHCYSNDSTLSHKRKKDITFQHDSSMELDSLERSTIRKRRFSVACGTEINNVFNCGDLQKSKERLTGSWRDLTTASEEPVVSSLCFTHIHNGVPSTDQVFVSSVDYLYGNLSKPGPLTIQVSGSPVENRRNVNDNFDPDTLDRKSKSVDKKRIEKILLKSTGSFKHKPNEQESITSTSIPENTFTRKIGSLRQIYEAKTNTQDEEFNLYNSRQIAYSQDMFIRSVKAPDLLRHIDDHKNPPLSIVTKQRRGSDVSLKFLSSCNQDSPPGDRRRSEDKERFSQYSRIDNLNARKSSRRSARTRSRRTDLRKLYRTEDSGYMSTDSNESKRKASYLMQIRPKTALVETLPIVAKTVIKTPILHNESDTDDLESLCDGQSESGGESIETDSVFFGNFKESKEIYAELGISTFDSHNKISQGHEQIDSGFMGETNIILSGDSDSEHKSVISITTELDEKGSAASISKHHEGPYLHTVKC